MFPDKEQVMRWSKQELELLKNTFSHNEELLFRIRNVFFGFDDGDKELFKQVTPDLKLAIKKMFLPDLVSDVPIGQQTDLYATLSNILEYHPDVGVLKIEALDLAKEYLEKRFAVLCGEKVEGGSLVDLRSKEVTKMAAYMFLVNSYIDNRIRDLKVLANFKEKTPEEIKKQQAMDSNK